MTVFCLIWVLVGDKVGIVMAKIMKNSEMITQFIPTIIIACVLFTVVLIPMKVVAYGYLPPDDALRHAAKVVSGKDWNEVLVLRGDIVMDTHPGWHAVLSAFRGMTGAGPDSLVVFSVVALFALFCIVPLACLKRPESWLASMLIVAVASPAYIPMRLFLGRPYMFTMAALLVICFLWERLNEERPPIGAMTGITVLVAASTWIHCSWFLFAVPVLALFAARRWRAAGRMAACTALGIAAGAIITGSPAEFLQQTYLHAARAFTGYTLERMLVFEFKPFDGNNTAVAVVFFLLIWRKLRGRWKSSAVDNPVFILGCLGWVLGYVSTRFWTDWGMPALMLWMAGEIDDVGRSQFGRASWARLFFAAIISVTLFMAVTNDAQGRWTKNLNREYITMDDPRLAGWFPGEGGIVYNDQMEVFYETFYSNPNAPWRYILGFEPAMMPEGDLDVFRGIQWDQGAYRSFAPWVKKMRPQDRIIIKRRTSVPPGIPALEWYPAAKDIWIGRLKHRK